MLYCTEVAVIGHFVYSDGNLVDIKRFKVNVTIPIMLWA